MIKISPPQSRPYLFPSQLVASVGILVQKMTTPGASVVRLLQFSLFDASGARMQVDGTKIRAITSADLAAFDAQPAAVAASSCAEDEERALPLLKTLYDLDGTVSP